MPSGLPVTGTLGPATTPFGLPQNLGGASAYIVATPNNTTASIGLSVNNISGYTMFTIYRVSGGVRTPLRTATSVLTGGALSGSFTDNEAPLGVSLTYVLNADGSDVATSNVVSLTYLPSTFWLKDPTSPNLNIQTAVVSMDDVTRPARVLAKADVLGRATPIVITDVRGSRTGGMTLLTTDSPGQTNLVNLFADGGVLFFQAPPNYGFPDMYFIGEDLKEHWGGIASNYAHLWSFTFTEVAAPASTTNVAALNTWAQVVNFGTWQNVVNKRTTWQDLLNRPWTAADGS